MRKLALALVFVALVAGRAGAGGDEVPDAQLLLDLDLLSSAPVSTETTVIDESGTVILGSKAPFLKKRDAGTERADKAAPEAGVDKFFGGMPTWEILADPTPVDVVILPAIDGNFAPSTAAMIPFERQFQTFHSLQNYFLLNELLAPGHTMPIVDTESLRAARAAFVQRFTERPYFFVRAATPQVLLDEVERVL